MAAQTPSTSPFPGVPPAERWADRLRLWPRRTEVRRLRELLELGPATRLLDVGGGTGSFTARYASGLADVSVIEPREERVALARRDRPHLRFIVGHAESLPYEDLSFDRVVAVRSVHHMARAERFIAEAARVLVPGGSLVVEEMAPGSLTARLLAAPFGGHHGGGVRLRDPQEMRALLVGAGFERVETRMQGRYYFIRGRRPTAQSDLGESER